jgi:hypothetical protein
MASFLTSAASVAVSSVTGAPVVPAGFSALGVVAGAPAAGAAGGASTGATSSGAAASGTGTTAAGGAAAGAAVGAGAAAAGGGISAATVGLIAVGGAAAAAAVVVAKKEDTDPLDVDDDGDGLTENQGDCNDNNAAVNPSGSVDFMNARFEPAGTVCPAGATGQPLEFPIVVTGTNHRCDTVTISSVSVLMTIVNVNNTNDTVGDTFTLDDVPFSPGSIGAAGGSATIRLTPTAGNCSNPRGGRAGQVDLSGQVTLQTSAGTFTVNAGNNVRVDFPLSGFLGQGSSVKHLR